MNLTRKSLSFAFLITLCTTLFFPFLKIYAFAPFLIITYYKKPLITSLWIALFCGLFLDILSPNSRLGINLVSFTLATTLLHGQQKNFFADTISTLPLMTFFFSVLTTLFSAILYSIPLHIQWIFTDLLFFPFIDALYAFAVFILPSLLFGKRRLRGEDYFA